MADDPSAANGPGVCAVTEHDKWRQRFERLAAERRDELGEEPSGEDVREIINQLERERTAELEALVANADAEIDDEDLVILEAMSGDIRAFLGGS